MDLQFNGEGLEDYRHGREPREAGQFQGHVGGDELNIGFQGLTMGSDFPGNTSNLRQRSGGWRPIPADPGGGGDHKTQRYRQQAPHKVPSAREKALSLPGRGISGLVRNGYVNNTCWTHIMTAYEKG
jgi:hypothetical protein